MGAAGRAELRGRNRRARSNALEYQEWLTGYNGRPLRAPAMRIPDRIMKSLRAGLAASGLPVTSDPDSELTIGRNPA